MTPPSSIAESLMASQPKPERFDVAAMRDAIRSLLEAAGLEVEGTDLEETPDKVARSWIESYLDGYEADPAAILKDTYESPTVGGSSQMVLLKEIPFHGMCPHHLLPFHGRAHVAYIPGKKLASLSSLARLVDCYAHRLEIQESVTRQIAEALSEARGRSRNRCRSRHRPNLHDDERRLPRRHAHRDATLHRSVRGRKRSALRVPLEH